MASPFHWPGMGAASDGPVELETRVLGRVKNAQKRHQCALTYIQPASDTIAPRGRCILAQSFRPTASLCGTASALPLMACNLDLEACGLCARASLCCLATRVALDYFVETTSCPPPEPFGCSGRAPSPAQSLATRESTIGKWMGCRDCERGIWDARPIGRGLRWS